MDKVKKLPKKKYLRIDPFTFKNWIREIMKEEKNLYATPYVVSLEIQERYGGLASSHMARIRAMRLNMQDFLPTGNEGEKKYIRRRPTYGRLIKKR